MDNKKTADFLRKSGKLHWAATEYMFYNGLNQGVKVKWYRFENAMWYDAIVLYCDFATDPKRENWRYVSNVINQFHLHRRNSVDDNLEPTEFLSTQVVMHWLTCVQYQSKFEGTETEVKRYKQLIDTLPIYIDRKLGIEPPTCIIIQPTTKAIKKKSKIKRHD